MKTDTKKYPLSAIASILMGILNSGLIIYAVVVPAEQRDDMHLFFENFNRNPFIMSIAWLILIVTSLLALLVIPAITDQLILSEDPKSEILSAAKLFGLVGYATSAVSFLTLLARTRTLSEIYITGDSVLQEFIVGYGLPQLDPLNVIVLGGPGLWILIVSLKGLKLGKHPKVLHYLGIILGFFFWMAVLAQIVGSGVLDIIAAGGGALIAPVWFIWYGVILYRQKI